MHVDANNCYGSSRFDNVSFNCKKGLGGNTLYIKIMLPTKITALSQMNVPRLFHYVFNILYPYILIESVYCLHPESPHIKNCSHMYRKTDPLSDNLTYCFSVKVQRYKDHGRMKHVNHGLPTISLPKRAPGVNHLITPLVASTFHCTVTFYVTFDLAITYDV